MFMLVLLLQLSGPPILTVFSDLCTGSRYRNVLNTKLSPSHIRSSSLLLHVTCVISSQSSLLDPLNHLHWSPFFNLKFTPVSRSQTVLFGMLHCGTSFLLHFMYLTSLVHHHYPALLHRKALILDRLLSFLIAFTLSTLALKPLFFSRSLSLHSHLSVVQVHLL